MAKSRRDRALCWSMPMTSDTDWRWYITIASIREYMAIMGCSGPLEDTNPDFLAAEEALGRYSLTAALAPKVLPSGAVLYRSGKMRIRGRGGRRLEFVVVEVPRAEGLLPQLVSVRSK